MGLMNVGRLILGGGRNVIAETAGVFRENSESGAQRNADYAQTAMAQFGAEFAVERKGRFDRFMDGLNRLPRPLMVVATFALFASAMFDPLWFAERMQGLALVPEPLWWLAGTIVSFYFAGRFQITSQQMAKSISRTTAMVPQVMENIRTLRALRFDSPGVADTGTDADLTTHATAASDNTAVSEWERQNNG